ncbi:MAG: hypothetical protein U9R23_02895 [Candidatus Cloacimonadota bacterium]|nr:hypothetical protein [Candidatus Cloacimonadota bacterium]
MRKKIIIIILGFLFLPTLYFSNEVESIPDLSFRLDLPVLRILTPESTILECDSNETDDVFGPMKKKGDNPSKKGEEEQRIERRGHRIRIVVQKKGKKSIIQGR